MHGHGFNWFEYLFGTVGPGVHVLGAVLVASLLIVGTFLAASQMRRLTAGGAGTFEGALIPESRLSLRNIFEIIAESIYKFVESVLGEHDTPKFFPLIGTLFVFIFFSNLMGLIPGMLPPTDNFNTTLALGTFVFVYYNWIGIKSNGIIGYLKHFMGPVWWLAPLIFIIELVSHVVRPLSLGLRLRGNIMGDHLVLSIFMEKAPVVVPVIFYGLGVFVSFIQAFVFCLLTMIYINLASSHEH